MSLNMCNLFDISEKFLFLIPPPVVVYQQCDSAFKMQCEENSSTKAADKTIFLACVLMRDRGKTERWKSRGMISNELGRWPTMLIKNCF